VSVDWGQVDGSGPCGLSGPSGGQWTAGFAGQGVRLLLRVLRTVIRCLSLFSLAVGRRGFNVAGRPASAFMSAGLFLSRIYGQYSVGGCAVG